MSNKKWTEKTKFEVVLAGIKGQLTISELCARYGVSQTQYYKWRDTFLSEGMKIFNRGSLDGEKERLRRENTKLKTIIGDLTTELKKNEYED
ncbi:transposase [bacterium]|nr:transposase [bacterium]